MMIVSLKWVLRKSQSLQKNSKPKQRLALLFTICVGDISSSSQIHPEEDKALVSPHSYHSLPLLKYICNILHLGPYMSSPSRLMGGDISQSHGACLSSKECRQYQQQSRLEMAIFQSGSASFSLFYLIRREE